MYYCRRSCLHQMFCQEVVVAACRGPSPSEIVVHDLVHKVDKLQDA